MKSDLESWYADLGQDQRFIAMELRNLILSRSIVLREELKWNQPCFIGNAMVCYIQKAKRHMVLGFGKGTELADPERVLQGSGSQMRHVKIPLAGHLDKDALQKLISDAIKIDSCP